ncbi:MAG: hypothetical protein RL141_174 [Candidatus Parcubacteria bacterium]|jgi:ADP-ribosylglycohydrolase
MASTKPIRAAYSPTLDGMTAYIHAFLARELDEEARWRAHKGIADFCYKNSSIFKKEFLRRIGIQALKRPRRVVHKDESGAFVSALFKMDAECVFLLKDTYDMLETYQRKSGRGFGLLVNRMFLCRTEEDYFTLIKLVYDALIDAENLPAFEEKYFSAFQQLIERDPHFADRAKKLFDYVRTHASSDKILFVDIGFQFTFSIFCSAAMRHFGNVKADFYSYSTYPWLQEFFKKKYFSKTSEVVLDLELTAIKNFRISLQNRAAGTLVGFAIGDALGFPVAGIDAGDVPKFIDGEITKFTDNKKHPFFHHLKKGQYTDNTKLLILSARHLIKNRGFVPETYQDDLVSWGKGILRNPDAERWAGPTAITAVKNLIEGKRYFESGSTATESCSATYRVVPLGLFYRPFVKDGVEVLKKNAEISAMFTHNSEISKTGAAITALIIGNLMHGLLPEKAVNGALGVVGENVKTVLLIRKIRQAMEISKTQGVERARKEFGSGSPIYQTLPLAIFCFLKFQTDFEKAILAAANSYRDDTPEEKERLQTFSWEEQLQYAKGGNTDGIAALTGAFMGAHLGMKKIPKQFLSIEDKNKLTSLAQKLV